MFIRSDRGMHGHRIASAATLDFLVKNLPAPFNPTVEPASQPGLMT